MNRTDKELVAAMIIATGLFALGLMLGYDTGKTDACDHHPIDRTPELIWNDDFESFPGEGELIRIEKDDEEVIYLGPVEE
jgi:hypothetical protein